jgi:hypothetical protein
MPMIGHQAPSQDAHRETLGQFRQQRLKCQEIPVLLEQPQTTVGAVQHVEDVSTGATRAVRGMPRMYGTA